jgi:hypothetical protein
VLLETEEDSVLRSVHVLLTSPRLGLARWYSSLSADRARQVHVALRQHFPRCRPARDVPSALGGLRLEDDRWVPWADGMAAHHTRAAQDIERLVRDAVLTRRVLQLERVRAATGTWPAELPPFDDDACPDLAWRYELHPDGGATLGFAPEIDWSEHASGVVLPERIDLAP